jgi:hypothetical protein
MKGFISPKDKHSRIRSRGGSTCSSESLTDQKFVPPRAGPGPLTKCLPQLISQSMGPSHLTHLLYLPHCQFLSLTPATHSLDSTSDCLISWNYFPYNRLETLAEKHRALSSKPHYCKKNPLDIYVILSILQ